MPSANTATRAAWMHGDEAVVFQEGRTVMALERLLSRRAAILLGLILAASGLVISATPSYGALPPADSMELKEEVADPGSLFAGGLSDTCLASLHPELLNQDVAALKDWAKEQEGQQVACAGYAICYWACIAGGGGWLQCEDMCIAKYRC